MDKLVTEDQREQGLVLLKLDINNLHQALLYQVELGKLQYQLLLKEDIYGLEQQLSTQTVQTLSLTALLIMQLKVRRVTQEPQVQLVLKEQRVQVLSQL